MPVGLGRCDVIIDIGDETLTNQSNKSNKYASIVASEHRAELFDRIDTLERDNLTLRGMLCVKRNRVDHLRLFIDDIPICSSRNEEHEEHLKLILGLLQNKELDKVPAIYKQLRFLSDKPIIKRYLPFDGTIDVVDASAHGRWAIPLDKGLLRRSQGFDGSWGGGILRRLEAFVASPIGCGGSDVGIA
ncbi:hypothetical protein Tco_0294356 [Tanacetum coccineum]